MSAAIRMDDKDLYLEMMNELIEVTTVNRITTDLEDRYSDSRINRGRVKPATSTKVATLQRFFDREKQDEFRRHNRVSSDLKYSGHDNDSDEEDDDHDEFYDDDHDTVSSMLQNFKSLQSSASSVEVLLTSREDIQGSNDRDCDMDTFDSIHFHESPTKGYPSSPSKPKYYRNRMDGKQLDMLSTSLHTSDGTEVTATETDYSLNGSSHHSHTTMMRSPYQQHRRQHSSVKENEFFPTATVYECSCNDETTSKLKVEVPDIFSLQTHCLLGEGYFGKVYLVNVPSDTTNQTYYALKMISKYHLLCEDQVHTVMREKEILQQCSHPNIATLYATKQDASSLYLLQSFIPGGDLFHMIHHFSSNNQELTETTDHPILSEESNVQFYVACVADALWYLHCGFSDSSAVVYRDLKQENIMINERGYPILIDFGYAKQLKPPSLKGDDEAMAAATSTKTYTMCGTAKYVSPEIIEGIGHSCSTDYWSLGIVVYELLTHGRDHPFEFVPYMDDISLYRNVVEADYIPLPDDVSADGIDFVDQLLAKDPTARLGTTANRNHNPILLHPWLRKWDVSLLRQQSYHAPWIPTLQNPLDPTVVHVQGQNSLTEEDEHSLVFDMDQQTDPNLTMKEQKVFADF